MERLRTRQRPGETKCPYCHDGFATQERVVSCGGCATIYHADCLRDELRSCASLGCEVRPELGKAFAWSEREAQPRGQGIVCCPEGASKRGDPLVICNGCKALAHLSCQRANPCCPGEDTTPLVREPETVGSILMPSTKVWLTVLLLLAAGFGVRILRFNASVWPEAFVWMLAIIAVLTVGMVLLYRRLDQRL